MAVGGLRRRLALLFAMAGVVTALLAALIVGALVQLERATTDRVEVYGPALLSTETLFRAYSDQQTGLRGFLLAGGREEFLEPYQTGRSTERDALADTARLLEGDPGLLAQLAAVQAAAREWHRQVAMPAIRAARSEGGVSREVIVDAEQGKERFDAIREELTALQEPVLARRDAANDDLNDAQRQLQVVLTAALVGLLLIAAGTWQALRRWVTDPLARLGAAADRVEAGELSRAIEVEGAPAEIAALAAQVEGMRIRILQEFALAEQSRQEALQARELVEAQAEDLRRSNAELEQFAYVASHDLQEPLRKVASFCQLIERRYKGQLDERGEQYIEFAVDGAKRMQQLINDLLAFSRVGRSGADLEPVDLEDVLAQALRQLSALIEDSEAEVTHDPLPTVRGDASLLVQLLQNLVGNGLKFRSEQAPRVHIGVRRMAGAPGEMPDEPMWEFTCSDNGIGIDPQYEDKIFVIFQRLHGRDSYGGTGIGLAMCKKIVEHHGGRLWLDPERPGSHGTGATFRWTLPVAAEDSADREPAPTSTTDDTTVTEDETERTADDAAARATG
ncbi:MAG TPA: CHASE3 domain-containing protein [Actinomycetes bacterium]|nr:CHASE3 domain-containing protein [Actinomycetes bacterium]